MVSLAAGMGLVKSGSAIFRVICLTALLNEKMRFRTADGCAGLSGKGKATGLAAIFCRWVLLAFSAVGLFSVWTECFHSTVYPAKYFRLLIVHDDKKASTKINGMNLLNFIAGEYKRVKYRDIVF